MNQRTPEPAFEHLTLERKDRLVWLRVNRPPLNDLNPAVIDELTRAHRLLAQDESVGMVVLGGSGEKFFCNGLSPEYVLAQDADGRAQLFEKLFTLMREMYAFPKIEAACIGGHAMAGGAVLGILCDFRFMADSNARFGFSEVAAGLTMPAFLLDIIAGVTGPQHLVKIALLATAFRAQEALAIGLVDAVHAPENLEREVETYLNNLMDTLPVKSMQHVKQSIRAKTLSGLEAASSRSLEGLRDFITGDFDEGLRAVLERRRPVFASNQKREHG